MVCITTHSSDVDTTYNQKRKRAILPICHHIKSPIKRTQNNKMKLKSPHPQTPIHSQTEYPLQTEKSDNPYIIQNLTFSDEIQTKSLDTLRLIYQNVGGLELSNDAFTLEKKVIVCFDKQLMSHVYPKLIRIGNIRVVNLK